MRRIEFGNNRKNKKEVKLLQPKIDIVFQSLFNAKTKK